MFVALISIAVIPWEQGPYQALGFAKVWAGKARLPSVQRMWNQYPGAGKLLYELPGLGQSAFRLFDPFPYQYDPS